MIVYKYFLKLAFYRLNGGDTFPSHLYGNGPFSSARKTTKSLGVKDTQYQVMIKDER